MCTGTGTECVLVVIYCDETRGTGMDGPSYISFL